MCGVFGFVSYDGKGPHIGRLQAIARKTMTRGAHAFGFSWIDGAGRLRMFKRQGRIVDHLDLLEMAHDARFLIGHCRYATHGAPADNGNNHPHPADGGWIVHNGVVGRYRSLVAINAFAPVTDCDSEVLGMIIEQETGTLAERCAAAVEAVADSAVVMLGLWSRPARLIAFRSGNPLSIGLCSGDKRIYLGSLPDCLPGDVREVGNRSGLVFTASKMESVHLAPEPVF